MKKNLLVSVVVPVYNTDKYLAKCLKSVVGQEYTNLEILVIDDGSTDKSQEIADKFAEEDARITVVYKANGGVSSARNVGIELSRGDFITFIDSDDMIHEKYVSNLLSDLMYTEAQVVTTVKAINFMSDESFLSKVVSSGPECKRLTSTKALIALYNGTLEEGDNGIQMFKSDVIRNNKIFYDTSMSIGEDFDFFAKVIIASDSIAVDNRSMYFYRFNNDSVTHESFSIKKYNCIYNVQRAGRSVEDQIPEIKTALNSNLLINSVSYGAIMYDICTQYPKEFEQIKMNINKYKYSTLFSKGVKATGRIKALIVVMFGTHLGLRLIKKIMKA